MLAKEFIQSIIEIGKTIQIQPTLEYCGNTFHFRSLVDTNNLYAVKCNKYRTFYIRDEHRTSPDAYYCSFMFLVETGLIEEPLPDLPKNIYDWSIDDFFYYELKYL